MFRWIFVCERIQFCLVSGKTCIHFVEFLTMSQCCAHEITHEIFVNIHGVIAKHDQTKLEIACLFGRRECGNTLGKKERKKKRRIELEIATFLDTCVHVGDSSIRIFLEEALRADSRNDTWKWRKITRKLRERRYEYLQHLSR